MQSNSQIFDCTSNPLNLALPKLFIIFDTKVGNTASQNNACLQDIYWVNIKIVYSNGVGNEAKTFVRRHALNGYVSITDITPWNCNYKITFSVHLQIFKIHKPKMTLLNSFIICIIKNQIVIGDYILMGNTLIPIKSVYLYVLRTLNVFFKQKAYLIPFIFRFYISTTVYFIYYQTEHDYHIYFPIVF